ncbi:hypothetical protein [Dehalobacter restrictus]|nr:hypothetical protein [Dehalobacter restrictus]
MKTLFVAIEDILFFKSSLVGSTEMLLSQMNRTKFEIDSTPK